MPPDSYGTKYGTVVGTEKYGHSLPQSLPALRIHITQKVRMAVQRMLGLYDVATRLTSLALEYGPTLETIGDLIPEAKLIPAAGIWRLSAGGSGPEQIT